MKHLIVMFTAIIFISTASAEKVALDFEVSCTFVPGDFFLVQTYLKLKGSDSIKLYQIQCSPTTKKCFGIDISISDKKITTLGLTNERFDADSVVVSKTGGSFIYRNVSFSADSDSNFVRIKIDFSDRTPPTEETWEGSCK